MTCLLDVDDERQPTGALKRRHAPPHEQLIGLVLLAVALVVGCYAVDSGLRSRNHPPPSDQVTVTGSAEQDVMANQFEWDASVASTKGTTSAALAQLSHWSNEIRASLESAGARSNEVSFGSVVVQPNVEGSGAVGSFTLSESITVRSTRLSAMKHVLTVSNHLLAHDIPFIAQGPQYTYNGLKKLRPVLTSRATADARARAQAALNGHGHLGKSISIYVGPFSVDAPGSVNIGSGDYDTASVQKVVSVAVTATYATSS